MDTTLLFFMWLEREGRLDKFINNRVSCVSDSLFFGSPRGFLSGAFCWKDSPEGHYYWSDANTKWKRYLEENGL